MLLHLNPHKLSLNFSLSVCNCSLLFPFEGNFQLHVFLILSSGVEIKVPDEKFKTVTKTLNSNMSVQKFAGLVQRLFGVRDNAVKLSYINQSVSECDL